MEDVAPFIGDKDETQRVEEEKDKEGCQLESVEPFPTGLLALLEDFDCEDEDGEVQENFQAEEDNC